MIGAGIGARFEDRGFALAWDRHHNRAFIEPGPGDDLLVLGFECANDADLDTTLAALRADGIEVADGGGELAARRSVERVDTFTEVGGNRAEVYCGPKMRDGAFESKHVRSGFVADELGLGHCVVRVRNREEAEEWYCRVLGFGFSDHIKCEIGGFKVDITFLHVNPRHHSIALCELMSKRIHHMMWQVGAMDDVGMTYDRCTDNRVKIIQTLGRHPNDKMFSFYAMTPSGFEFEYGWGARNLGEDREPTTYDQISEWGHRRLPYPKPNGRV